MIRVGGGGSCIGNTVSFYNYKLENGLKKFLLKIHLKILDQEVSFKSSSFVKDQTSKNTAAIFNNFKLENFV